MKPFDNSLVACVLGALVGACLAGLQCPPGGRYWDKHLGQHGRYACCSELCVPAVFKDQCEKKCPNYSRDTKARETALETRLKELQEGQHYEPQSAASTDRDDDPSPDPIWRVTIGVITTAAVLGIVGFASVAIVRRWRARQHREQMEEIHLQPWLPQPDNAAAEGTGDDAARNAHDDSGLLSADAEIQTAKTDGQAIQETNPHAGDTDLCLPSPSF
ncbi:uncharacterized protein LOC143280947 [Babylonia areolata]|uniref:uncharacterized protein LOC143280947 n=1 Tax=Babylonia areolata TaxID=304850 RepID=UPI003FD41EB1